MRKVIAKIDISNIQRNAQAFQSLTGKRICAVVKANAYGHGAEEVVNGLEGIVDCFAVSLLSEALAIRTVACGKDVLILTPPLTETDGVMAAKNQFILTVENLSCAQNVVDWSRRYDLPVRVHLKVNTGMNRYGMDESTLRRVCALLASEKGVRVEGLYSHIYDYTRENAERQRLAFLQMREIANGYFPRLLCHLSATYGALLGQDFSFDMMRIGIGLYGYLPDGAQDVDERVVKSLSLQRAMTVWTQVSAVRTYKRGGVGYGKATAEKDTPVYVARYGYADGWLRKRKNGVVGQETQLNNLCMDACVRKGEQKTGAWLPIMTNAAQTAKATDTISYEVLCAATRRAEMVYEDVTFCE